MLIRPEREADYDTIDAVVAAAFGQPDEAKLVRRLRSSDAYVPELTLVADDAGEVVGHIMLSYTTLEGDGPPRVLSLAPLAVKPGVQRTGIGIALTRTALDSADERGEPLVVVLGHATYYPRFGFEPAHLHGIQPPDPNLVGDHFMVVRLSSYDSSIRGRIVYPPAFDEVG